MLEISDPEINVDRLMHQIREAVAKRNLPLDENGAAPLFDFAPPSIPSLPAQTYAPPLKLQPEFQTRADDQYHVNDLLKYHGRDFVRNAYRAILKREPDEAGLLRHLEHLASGRFNKIDILSSLRFSSEGEGAGVKIAGLSWPSTIRRLERVPVIGYLIQVVIGVGRLPRLLRHQRQYEFYQWSQQQQIVDYHNQTYRQLSEYHDQLAEVLTHAITKVETDARQLQDLTHRHSELKDALEERLTATQQALTAQLEERTRHLEERTQQLLQEQQQQMRTELLRLEEQRQQILQQEQQTHAELGQLRELMQTELASLKEQAHTEAARLEQIGAELVSLEEHRQQLLRHQQQTHRELLLQERRLTLLLDEARAPATDALAPHRLEATIATEEDHLLDALYASFEDQFRGPRDEIKNRLRVYLPILKEAQISADVLDIGCGRGEWLELLKDEGIQSRGVDHNRIFVEQCRESGLNVLEEDALRYLRSLPDESLSAVTSFHLVEHLPFEILIELLDEMVRVLKPNGLLILETPNPENFIVSSYSFYADPTHRNPIPSPTLQFLLEARGLSRIKVMRLRPRDEANLEGDAEIIKRFNEYFCAAPDYGIIGWKI